MNEMNEINHFDEYWQAPIACFIVFLGALWVFRSPVRKLILIVVDLFEDHFNAGGDRGTVTRSAPFTNEDIESALRKREAVLKRSELLDCIPVVKDMSKAAKVAIITPQSVKRDSIEERPGVFAFEVDTTEDFKEREGILN
jgi:hypothetical protein